MNVIELKNVSKSYPGTEAVRDISLKVMKGSIHGLIGPNGAGKTTTMNIIAGLTTPTSGEVIINGKGIGLLPENPPLYLNMKVGEFLTFVAEINGVDQLILKKQVKDIIKKCGLIDVEGRIIGNLSKGFKQRVGIASTLVFSPEIIILDEPTVGLDPFSIMEIRELIVSLKKEHTILLSTHQLHEANLICSDITIISKGTILQSGPLAEIQKAFRPRQVVKALVRDWKIIKPDEILKEVREFFPCENVEVETKNDQGTELRFFSQTNDDFRPIISNYLINKKVGLLKFEEEAMDLEEIFIRSTKG
jgi:ABC-2 type transport system ATP-binding protein